MIQHAGAPDAAAQIAGLVFAVLLVDAKGIIVEANPAAEDLLERSVHRLVGTNLLEVSGISDERVRDTLADPDLPLIARGVTISTLHRERRYNLTSSPLHASPGWRVITLSDAGQADHEADDTDRAELRAPAVLAHEIKNPLSAIRGASQLLARRATARDLPLAQMIGSEVDRIAALIDRMQQLGSSADVAISPCNPHAAIRNAVATIRTARPDSCELQEEFDPSLPMVAADQGALEQVLINLIANACDAVAGMGEPRVTVRTRFASGLMFSAARLSKPIKLPIEITVSDSGEGIDPALRDHIFEPFVSSKPHGQGLGLPLVRKLVRDMGGRIAHERDNRAGLTHFRINLPVAAE
ncbi:two-component system sensor histidine kinase NtrB [Qipengyuania marisflavi]|uniref:histidine kinase n=1 Tax=Qipengyuania marisflavi TaxID=2486356 RepID=A0A5S3P906_9SPHN|nr:ATP-binding protein [Qipengyuania marisflavi]TMM49931.1 PAS domain-containing protein [Qipengyuania marisflavi]